VGAPLVERLSPSSRQAVDATATTALLALLVEQSRLGEASALGVDLRVGDRPEMEDADLGDLLELIRGGGPALIDQAEHCVRGIGEAWRGDARHDTVQLERFDPNDAGGTMTSLAETPTQVSPRHGFDSLTEETQVEGLPVTGALPQWLAGSLIRTGPAKGEVGERTMNPWFDGLAMLHRFSFARGEVSYANRFLETRAYRAARDTGRISYSEFATDPCRSLYQRVTAMFSPKLTDNANVNLVKLGERFIAMTETPIPVEFDADTLGAAGVAYDVPGHLTTAHPHMDRGTKGMLNYAAKLGPRSSYRFFLLPPGASKPRVIASAPVSRPAYMHSFGLTERWLVLAEFPYVVNPPSLAFSGRPYIENYRWRPELGTRFHLFDRATGESTGPFETDARFGFHHVNAYEDGDDVIADICTFEDAEIVQDLYLERLRAGKPVARPRLERFRISTGTGDVATEQLIDEPLELPRINYGRCNERP